MHTSASRLDEQLLDDILRAEPDDVRLALGTPADGVDGFRRTHHDTIRAARVAAHWLGPSVLTPIQGEDVTGRTTTR
ncbi:hypothetical protein ACFWUP_19805 [Nocardia sp. NPDC058658]|uniref:hypothetical protein n=1 Tax=Nocardia sp. NPDC058658 TaxID=3346580 RepID=UPI003669FB67